MRQLVRSIVAILCLGVLFFLLYFLWAAYKTSQIPDVASWLEGEPVDGTRAVDAPQAEEEAVSEELLARQKRYALIVGNSAYAHFADLPGVEEDLKVLPETLEKAGFSVTVRENLNSSTLESAVREFIAEFGSEPHNQLLIYFASHGATDDNGTGYIVPVDAPLPTTDVVGFRRKAMSMNIVQAIAKDAIAKHMLFVFDACFAGTIFEGRRAAATRTIREGYDQNTRFFISAGGADETVLDRSIFRDQFVRGVLGAADSDEDDFIIDVELGQFLAKAVYDDEHAPHRPRWGWMSDARFDKGVWAIPVPGSYRTVSSPGLNEGARFFLSGDIDAARDVWNRYALAGDVRVMKHLGDFYGGAALEELGLVDPASVVVPGLKEDRVQAIAWYARTIAWFVARDRHDVLVSDDKLLRQSLRAFLRLRAETRAHDFAAALVLTRNMLESGGAQELYTLGLAYLVGVPFDYDLFEGMHFLRLAADQQIEPAQREFAAREALLTYDEVQAITERAARWRPPAFGAYSGSPEEQGEIDRLRKELQAVQNERALALVSDIDIDILKRLLRSLGFYEGPIDNEVGPEFRAAIRRYQTARNAEPTGVLTARQTVQLVTESANTGYPMAAYVLGVMYHRGIGVAPDGALAVKWLTAAADQDLAIAHYALGVVFRDGSEGGANPVAPDIKASAKHFVRAAALGYAPAERALAQLTVEAPATIE